MKAKTALILAHLDKNGKVTVKMDRASGFSVVTITKRAGGYVVGTIPGAKLGGKSSRTKMIRSLTPRGLAKAVMIANSK